MHNAPGKVGPFEILGEIGRGGMGVVYRARDTRLGRDVAIKALPDHVAEDPSRLERFQREARSLAQISHPNIAGIFGVEEQDNRYYLVLEFVEGTTLGERLDPGALPIDETIHIAIQIASAIEAAHDAGIIHRDLKPDNIKITPEGRIKVLDFGLAKSDNTSALSSGNTATASIRQDATAPGVILGTAAYMSPEQVRGRHVDKRTDLWALGVILYEMLTGIGPFRGDTATDSIGAVLHKDIDYNQLPEKTPLPLVRLIMRCLTRDRERRLRDAGDARLELEEALHAPAETESRTHASSQRWWLPLAVCVLAVAAVGWRYWNTKSPSTPLVRSSLIAPEGMAVSRPKISPDGQHIGAIGYPLEFGQLDTPTIDSLLYRSLDDAEFKTATVAGVEFFEFAPDSQAIIFAARGKDVSETVRLYRMPSDGSAPPVEIMAVPREYRPGGGPRWFVWVSSDELAFLDRSNKQLAIHSASTGKLIRNVALTSDIENPEIDSLTSRFGDRHVAASLQRYTETGFVWDIVAINITTGEITHVTENADLPMLVGKSKLIFARNTSTYACEFDTGTMSVTSAIVPAQPGLSAEYGFDHGSFDLSDNGTLIYLAGGFQAQNRRLAVINESGEETLIDTEPREYTQSLAVSGDGSRLAVIIPSPGGLYEIWATEITNPRLRRIAALPKTDLYEPIFTLDGEHIIATKWNPEDEERGSVIMIPFDGQGEPRRLFGGFERTTWLRPTSALPDGRSFLIQAYSPEDNRVLLYNLQSDEPPVELLNRSMIYTPRASPDGKLLAYVTDDTGKPEVYVRTLDTERAKLGIPIPVTNTGAWGCGWSVDESGSLRLHHTDMNRRSWITPVSLQGGRISVGETTYLPRVMHERIEDACMDNRGRLYAIIKGEAEKPTTHIELVQGWLQSLR